MDIDDMVNKIKDKDLEERIDLLNEIERLKSELEDKEKERDKAMRNCEHCLIIENDLLKLQLRIESDQRFSDTKDFFKACKDAEYWKNKCQEVIEISDKLKELKE
jgi:sulfur transfer protein SufE